MKKISQIEKNAILEMHSKLKKPLISEQVEGDSKSKLTKALSDGCVKNGKIVELQSKNPVLQFAIKQESTKTPGKFRYFFADNRVGAFDENGKFEFSPSKWSCKSAQQASLDASSAVQQSEIQQLKTQFGWKTREDLKNIGQEELTQLYQKHPKFELFKLKVESGKVGGYTNIQQKFIDQATGMGYKLQLTPEETASGKYKEYTVPNSEKYFPGGLKMFYSSETAVTSSSSIDQSFKELSQGQAPETRKECANAIKTYYEAWETRREIPQNVFDPMKRRVQACVNTHGKKFSGLGGLFSNVDDYIDRLSGGSGGPLSYGEEAKWRIMPPRIIKK